MRAASFQYKDHFLGSMQARVEALRAFLANFDVTLSLDDAGLMAVSTWLPHWADLLVDDFSDQSVRDAYRSFTVPWTGRLSGLNVIFDLGIYYAECLWARRTKLEWVVVRGPEGASHLIKGLPGGKWFDPIHFTYSYCWRIRGAKIAKRKRLPYSNDPVVLKSERFYGQILLNAPPGRRSRKSERR
jgi:hypothetical protein